MALVSFCGVKTLDLCFANLLISRRLLTCKIATLTAISADSKKKAIWEYDNKNIRQRKIKQLIRLSKATDGVKAADVVHFTALSTELKNLGFDEQGIEKMVIKKPRVLELSRRRLSAKLTAYKKAGLPYETIVQIMGKCPSLLLLDVEDGLERELLALQELPLMPRLSRERAIYMIQKCPSILLACGDRAELKRKVRGLKKMGFNEHQVFEIIVKHPASLTYKTETIEQKVQLVKEMNGRIALFVKFPRVLTASQRRIRERCEYLRAEGFLRDTTRMSENKIRSIVLTTDQDFMKVLLTNLASQDEDFAKRLVDRKIKDFVKFCQQFWKEFEEGKDEKDSVELNADLNKSEESDV